MKKGEKTDAEKEHLSVVIVGHVDSGKSTMTGRLCFEMGRIDEREMEKLRKKANELGKDSFCFAFYMDTLEEERKRGITIQCTTKEFYTDNFHYTIIDAPGHSDFIKNMISGASQADVAVLMVPADGGFGAAISLGDRKNAIVQGSTRQHGQLINLLGVKQLIVCVNKMDDKSVNYSEARFKEIIDEMKGILIKVGWPKAFVNEKVPFLPISGWAGDNLMKKSEKMRWWNGVDIKTATSSVHIDTLYDALDKFATVPKRKVETAMRVPVSACFPLAGKGTIVTGRVEQGKVNVGDKVVFVPKHSSSRACEGTVFSIEMHHKSQPCANPGDNVGMNIKGLDKDYLPTKGDVMLLKSDTTLRAAQSFKAQIQVLDHPNELKVGYTPIGHVRTNHCALRLTNLFWKMGKETGNQKVDNPTSLKTGDSAEVEFECQNPFVVESFKDCEGLGRVAIMEGNSLIMLGKVTSVTYKD